jgi:hypothetical protein
MTLVCGSFYRTEGPRRMVAADRGVIYANLPADFSLAATFSL